MGIMPTDERYASVHALETGDFRTEATDTDDLVIRETSGRVASLTHWSFGQLAIIASAPRRIPIDVGFVQGPTRLSQRGPWPDGRYVLDGAASRLPATVH